MNLQIVQTAMSYWLGALSEPVLIIARDDMAKAADKGMEIIDIRLISKSGGKSGDYLRESRES